MFGWGGVLQSLGLSLLLSAWLLCCECGEACTGEDKLLSWPCLLQLSSQREPFPSRLPNAGCAASLSSRATACLTALCTRATPTVSALTSSAE